MNGDQMIKARQKTQEEVKGHIYEDFNYASDLLQPWRPAGGTLADAATAIITSSTLNREAIKEMVYHAPDNGLTVGRVVCDENNQIMCPACWRDRGEEVLHINFEPSIYIDGNDKHQASEIVQGDVLAIPCSSHQCGHQFIICLGNQKGRIEIFTIINEGWIAEIFSE